VPIAPRPSAFYETRTAPWFVIAQYVSHISEMAEKIAAIVQCGCDRVRLPPFRDIP
jgi:hypothetical protein